MNTTMEKQTINTKEDCPPPYTPGRSRPRRSTWPVFVGFMLLILYLLIPTGTRSPSYLSNRIQEEPFSWDGITSKSYLDFHDCNDGFKCARLQLPMDYWNGTTDATVSIAVIKKPAMVPVTHPRYGGAILFNPGGPGGSGVSLVEAAADAFQYIIEPKDGKHFDYIGFDPRGVANSRPIIRCLDDQLWAQSWALRVLDLGVLSASDAAFGRLWSMTAATAGSCSLPRTDGEADIKQYVSTASVARDMIEIIERHGEWREKEADRILNGDLCPGRRGKGSVAVPETLKHQVDKEKINYWVWNNTTLIGISRGYANKRDSCRASATAHT